MFQFNVFLLILHLLGLCTCLPNSIPHGSIQELTQLGSVSLTTTNTFAVMNVKNKGCLDIAAANPAPGTNISAYPDCGYGSTELLPHRRYYAIYDRGLYILVSGLKTCVSIFDLGANDNLKSQICSDRSCDQWFRLTPYTTNPEGAYIIEAPDACLVVSDDTSVHLQAPCNKADSAAQWYLCPNGGCPQPTVTM